MDDSCQLLISNKCSVDKAEIIVIANGNHKWGRLETMQSWIAAGGTRETWSYNFSLLIVPDVDVNDARHLLSQNADGKNRFYFKEPDKETEIYNELLTTGQTTKVWEEVEHFIMERT